MKKTMQEMTEQMFGMDVAIKNKLQALRSHVEKMLPKDTFVEFIYGSSTMNGNVSGILIRDRKIEVSVLNKVSREYYRFNPILGEWRIINEKQ